MVSFVARLLPAVMVIRGSKRMFSSRERTLARIDALQKKPVPYEPPSSLRKRVDVASRTVAGWPVYDLSPRTEVASPRRALYLHGGCYVFEIDPLHWRLAANLAVEADAIVTVPIVPLAPAEVASEVVPAAADLAATLIAEVGADNVSIIGDSAGGGMALAVAMELRDRGLPTVGAIVLISPWLDISGTDPQLAVIAHRDPWLAVPGTHAAGALYRAELPESDFRVSPINGSFEGLGSITMFSGTRDILNADANRLVPLAAKAGITLDYHVGENMLHVYPILPMPEGDAARAHIVAAMKRGDKR